MGSDRFGLEKQRILTWLYNESPVKNTIIVNDRWGSGLRFKHAGIYTPEYQPDLDFEDHAWEESRGMGYSYGYNREEDSWDYNSTQSLVLQLIDKVSRGGNFLLDIGPDEHGKIPPIMQERLLQIGDWLKINGAAIYNTKRWKSNSQWSEGNREYKDRSGDMLLKITIDPDPGYAVKETFYTYNANTNSLYAILPKYPDNKKILLKDVRLPAFTAINFLSTGEILQWQQEGNNVVVNLPEYNPNKIKAPYAYVIKINNYGKFVAKPKVKIIYNQLLKPVVSIDEATDGATIYYTTDGTMPTTASKIYNKAFDVSATTTVKAIAIKQNEISSNIEERIVNVYELMKATKVTKPVAGLNYSYYEAEKMNVAKMNQSQPVKTGVVNDFNINNKNRKSIFGFIYTGYININTTGLYNFNIESDDGSLLYIDDKLIVNNDGRQTAGEGTDRAILGKGMHKIKVIYYDSGGDNNLNVFMQKEGGSKQEISSNILYH